MKPAVLPGEKMTVRIVRGGEEPGQGVGFLDDGTMVVVEQAKQLLNEEVEFTVSRLANQCGTDDFRQNRAEIMEN